MTRGSGARHADRECNISKWFVEQDLIDGVILLPDNLFYNTSAAGIIVVLSKRKPERHQDSIVLVNASRRVNKGHPKNYIHEEEIRPIAEMFLKRETSGRRSRRHHPGAGGEGRLQLKPKSMGKAGRRDSPPSHLGNHRRHTASRRRSPQDRQTPGNDTSKANMIPAMRRKKTWVQHT